MGFKYENGTLALGTCALLCKSCVVRLESKKVTAIKPVNSGGNYIFRNFVTKLNTCQRFDGSKLKATEPN